MDYEPSMGYQVYMYTEHGLVLIAECNEAGAAHYPGCLLVRLDSRANGFHVKRIS